MRGASGFVGFLLEALAPLGAVSARRMFGGVGLYRGDRMFALVARDELFLKVGEANRAAFEAAGQGPFTYPTKNGTHTITSYWSCPPELLDDTDDLRRWAAGSIAAAAAASKAPRKRKLRQKPGEKTGA